MPRSERTIGRVARSEDLRLRAGDLSLAATLTVPDSAGDDAGGRLPWALLVPSWLPRTRDGSWDGARRPAWFAPDGSAAPGVLALMADALAARGVATLCYDGRGCGDSGGSWEHSDLFARIDDARDAIGAMRSRVELDLRRVAIVGQGEAAVVALSVAIGDPAIGAVGLLGPSARSFRDVLRRGVATRLRTGAERHHPFVASLDVAAEDLVERVDRHEREALVRIGEEDVTLRLAAWEQAFRTPPLALVTMLHRNVVIAHGTEDAWADADESRLLVDALRDGGNDPLLQLVPGADHDLAGGPADTVAAFADALAARMEARELPPVLVAIEEMNRATLD